MKLRLATMADLGLLARWNKDLRADEQMDDVMTDEEIKNRMASFLQGNTYKTYFLEDDDVFIGYGMLDITRNPRYLRHLFIQRNYRQKGHGKKLIYLLMELLAIDAIDIEVMAWNQNALGFYNKLGFKPRYVGMRFQEGSI